jgi:hypothetical protein
MIYQREKPRERLEVGFKKFVTDFANHKLFMKDVLQPLSATFAKLLSPPAFATLYGDEAAKRLRYLSKLDNNDWLPVALKFFAHTKPTPDDAALFMRRLETLAYFLFVSRADINERSKRYANILTYLVGVSWKGKSIELSKEDKTAFRADLDGPIYEPFTRQDGPSQTGAREGA